MPIKQHPKPSPRIAISKHQARQEQDVPRLSEELPNISRPAGSKATGAIVGLGFGVALSTTLLFRLGGFYFLLPFVGFAPMVLGPVVGAFLSRMGAVPYLRPVPTIILALTIAIGPYVAGVVEMRQREFPFPVPADAQVVNWTMRPWGESVVIVESAEEVQDFLDQLVASANQIGWRCKNCFYQSSSGTGHASFGTRDAAAGQSSGYMGFEVWPGEMELYGTAPSELTVARIFHDLQTRSPTIVAIVLTVSLLATATLQLARKLFR